MHCCDFCGILWELSLYPAGSRGCIMGSHGIPPRHPTASRGTFHRIQLDPTGCRGMPGRISCVPAECQVRSRVLLRGIPRSPIGSLVSVWHPAGSLGISIHGTSAGIPVGFPTIVPRDPTLAPTGVSTGSRVIYWDLLRTKALRTNFKAHNQNNRQYSIESVKAVLSLKHCGIPRYALSHVIPQGRFGVHGFPRG